MKTKYWPLLSKKYSQFEGQRHILEPYVVGRVALLPPPQKNVKMPTPRKKPDASASGLQKIWLQVGLI